MKVLQLEIATFKQDFGAADVFFGLTLLDYCFVWGKLHKKHILRVGNWNGKGWTWEI